MSGWNPEDLSVAADLFGKLVDDDPTDSAAWPSNRALCLTWSGTESRGDPPVWNIASSASRLSAFDGAVDAWSLAEVLRQGGGAETLANIELRFACTIPWDPGDTSRLLDEFPEIHISFRRRRSPAMTRAPQDRSKSSNGSTNRSQTVTDCEERAFARGLPVVLATVYTSKNSLPGFGARGRRY